MDSKTLQEPFLDASDVADWLFAFDEDEAIGARMACWGWLFTPTTKRTAISSSITPIGKEIRRWRDIGLTLRTRTAPTRLAVRSSSASISRTNFTTVACLAFGPDGYLYLGLGDGGMVGDPWNNGQRRDTLLGRHPAPRCEVLKSGPHTPSRPTIPIVGNDSSPSQKSGPMVCATPGASALTA